MSFDESVEELQRRFEKIASSPQEQTPGVEEIAQGLGKLVRWVEGADEVDRKGWQSALCGLGAVADFLASGTSGADSASDEKPDGEKSADENDEGGLEQFTETFRKEAEKRIRGLSISLMGVFGGVGSDEAMEQTAGHLHAIRGGAAMLGLEQVAELARAMESVILGRRRLVAQERDWPTRTLLRAFALLQDAVESRPMKTDAEDLQEVLGRLRRQEPPTAPTNDGAGVSTAEKAKGAPERVATSKLEQPILVVDDVETIAASVGFILSELEVPIEVARHGEEAMKMLQKKPFSLVISDVDMPRMDGIALTRMVRASDELRHLPVILLTSLDHPEERKAGLEAGATDYLIKGSIGGGELLSKVQDLLEVAPYVEREIEERTRRVLVAEDTETVAASIAFVLSERPLDIVLATDGKDAYQRLQRESFDLLITDMQMPYMSGTELVTAIRGDEGIRQLPVIMLTSVQDEDAMNHAAAAGVDRYLIKGEIAGGKLLSVVEEMLAGIDYDNEESP